MSRIPWQPHSDPFRNLQREVGRLFQSLEPFQPWRLIRQFPALNLHDAGDRYVITVQLPGMAPEDVDLSITGEVLTLRGERKRQEGVSDESYRRQERPFGRFMRTVTLPDRVDTGRVTASFAQGLLTIALPKAEGARPRQIAVTASP